MTTNVYPNSLTNLVTEYVRERGQVKLSAVAEHFPEYTKKQIHDALSNARYRKLIKVIFRGHFRGMRESVWAPETERPTPGSSIKKKPPQPVASVWELGIPKIEVWPPEFEGGRRYDFLGPWEDMAGA